jgi:glycosyltransferase involved in cell wall biosynthesis
LSYRRTDRLAVCIPARDAAAHLPRLLESIRRQTTPVDEVLVYDDASGDTTGALAAASGATVIRTDVCTGPSVGKNVLAAHTTCEWLHFHDADEALTPGFVAHAQQLVADDIDVILFGTQDRDNTTDAALGQRLWDDRELQLDPIRYCILNTVTNCGVYRRQAFLAAGGFDTDPETKYNEDQAMHLRLALAGLRFRAANAIGVVVYRRQNSMSSGHPIECARAQYEVLARTASATGRRYSSEIGFRLWRLAAVSGSFKDWGYVRHCLALASELGYEDPRGEHPIVRLMARVSPVGAVRAREALIRGFKPALRRNVPLAK